MKRYCQSCDKIVDAHLLHDSWGESCPHCGNLTWYKTKEECEKNKPDWSKGILSENQFTPIELKTNDILQINWLGFNLSYPFPNKGNLT